MNGETVKLQPNIRERNPIVKREPTVINKLYSSFQSDTTLTTQDWNVVCILLITENTVGMPQLKMREESTMT